MAYSKALWARARGYYESGLNPRQVSLALLEDRECQVELNGKQMSHSKISVKAKREQWQQGVMSDYIKAHELIAFEKAKIVTNKEQKKRQKGKKEQEKGTLEQNKEEGNEKQDEINQYEITLQCADNVARQKVSLIEAQSIMKRKAYRVIDQIINYTSEVFDSKMPLSGQDVKSYVEAIDKALVTIDVNPRRSNITVNNTNAQQNNATVTHFGDVEMSKNVQNTEAYKTAEESKKELYLKKINQNSVLKDLN